jgi:Protein of unknown function (DUF2695)
VWRATVAGMTNRDDALLRSYLRYDEDEHLPDGYDDEIPLGPLPLEPARRASLAWAIDHGLREHGCDNTLLAARTWAVREKVPWGRLQIQLEERGGYCDCEVLLNVLKPPDT